MSAFEAERTEGEAMMERGEKMEREAVAERLS